MPLCTDRMTGLKKRISYARVLVEVDITKDLVTEVPIRLLSGEMRMQDVLYENLPKFCSLCQIIGHAVKNCKKNGKGNMQMKDKHPEGLATTEQAEGSGFAKETMAAQKGLHVMDGRILKNRGNGNHVVQAKDGGLEARAGSGSASDNKS